MAKSLRSKWRRKCRAIKRERYGAKELARLKKTLGINEDGSTDVEMSDIATVVSAKDIKDGTVTQDNEMADVAGTMEKMEVESGRVYNKKTLRDQYGNYPVWMNRRKIMKNKKGRAKSKKATAKTTKRLTRKQKKALTQKQS